MTSLKARESHFEFGANWSDFSDHIDHDRIDMAVAGLRKLVPDLAGKSFLDIGSGSGLSSLAALRLGAGPLLATDIDENAVATTRALLSRFAPAGQWESRHVSVFDMSAAEIGRFDVVHSWGVLHHTGAMWEAIRTAAALVKPGGLFVLAIYSKTPLCSAWAAEKAIYSRSPRPVQWLARQIYSTAFLATQWLIFGAKNPFRFVREYPHEGSRGMRWSNDIHDWLGGYPYESATPEEIDHEMQRFDFTLTNSWAPHRVKFGLFGTGCAEYVYRAAE